MCIRDRAFGYQKEAQRKFEEINNRLAGYSLRATFFSSITNPATRFVNSTVYAAVGITGAYAAIRGFMTVGQQMCIRDSTGPFCCWD